MNKFLSTTASALVLTMAISNAAEAKDGFYVALRGGFTDYNLNDYEEDNATSEAKADFDGVWQVSGALGYKYKYFRIEGEYIYRDTSDDDYKVKIAGYDAGHNHTTIESDSFMLNAYLDLMPNYWISPYIMGGIGVSRLEFQSYDVSIRGVKYNSNLLQILVGTCNIGIGTAATEGTEIRIMGVKKGRSIMKLINSIREEN